MLSMIWVISIIATIVVVTKKNLNMMGFIILALFFGPIGLIATLLVNPSEDRLKYNVAGFTLDQARQELIDMKTRIKYLMEDADLLANKIDFISSGQPSTKTKVKDFEPARNIQAGSPVTVHEYKEKPIKPKARSEGFEQIFGKYWLNRIGVVLFVIGIGLFINYSFQYLNAFAKVGIGFALSAAFFVWGNLLEKNKKYTKLAWGILGGAWGLCYLSTYAMYYIPETKIITSPVVELIMLSIVSIGAVIKNLKYNSWIATAMTFILALITAVLGSLDYSSVMYFSLLAGCIAYLSYKMKWHTFLVLGIVGSYISHILWTNQKYFYKTFQLGPGINTELYQFQIIFSILAISWIIYSVVMFMMPYKNDEEQNLLVTGKLFNVGLFTLMGLYEIDRVKSSWNIQWDEQYWFLIFLSAIYFLFAYFYKIFKEEKMIVVNMAIGFTLAGAAILIKVPGINVVFYWMLESVLLFILGLHYKEKLYRLLAAVLSICLMVRLLLDDLASRIVYDIAGLSIRHDIFIFCFAAIGFYFLGTQIEKKNYEGVLSDEEHDFYSWGFPVAGTVLLAIISYDEIASRWLSLSWTLLGAGLLAVGFFLKNKVYRISALCMLSLASLRVILVDMSGVNTIYKIAAFTVLGALLLGVSMIYSKYKIKN